MKILVLTSLFPPYIFGGAEIAAFNMVRMLVSRGHDVHVATLKEEGDEPAWGLVMPEGYTLYRLNIPRAYTLYGRTNRHGKLAKILWHFQDYLDPRNKREVRRLVDSVRPDHVDVHNIMGIGFNTLPVLEERGASVAYVLHDLGLACFQTSMFKNGKNCVKQCGVCAVTGFSRQFPLKKLKRVGFVSPSRANIEKLAQYVPFVKQKPNISLHNVQDDVPELPQRAPSDILRLLYVGRLDSLKGIDFLLRVLRGLAGKYKFHLTVLGKGPDEDKLRAEYEDANWVTFAGFVPSTEIPVKIVESDLYCIPSIWAETYGMTTAQALRLGRPVIGSNIGGTTELVRDGETGLLVAVGDQEAWTQAFERLFSGPQLLERLGKNAASYAHEFDNDAIAAKYEAFVKSL